MKKVCKILVVLTIVMMAIMVTTNVMAKTAANIDPSSLTGNTNTDISGIANIGNNVITILSTGGIVVSVIILIVLGIKYMLGSAEEKAEYKKTLMPYVIGAGLVFAASSVATMVYNFMQAI